MSELKRDVRNISDRDITLVQHLIEKCLQIYMKPAEVVNTLLHKAKIEPGFTEPILSHLERQNPEFFRAYKLRLIVKDQILRYNQLLEKHVELMGRVKQNRVVHSTLADGLPTHPMNYSAYPHQTHVMSQTQMSQSRVVPTTLANGLQTHSMNNYTNYPHQTPKVTYQTQMSPNGVGPSTLANGSQRCSVTSYSAYPHQTLEVMNQTQMCRNGVGPSTLANGSQRYSVNNYATFQHQTPEVMNQTQMGRNGVFPSTLGNGSHRHSFSSYSGYQHQTPELMSQTQLSQNGVVPTNLANGLQTHSRNYSNYQHQPPAVPSVASGNMPHMINPICDYYANDAPLQQASMNNVVGMQGHTGMMALASSSNAAGIMNEFDGVDPQAMFGGDDGLLEPYDMVNSEASIPPYNGGEYNGLPFNEALPALETHSFGHSGQMSQAIGFSNCSGSDMLNNYPLSPLLGNDFIGGQQDISGGASTSNVFGTEGFSSNGFGNNGFCNRWGI